MASSNSLCLPSPPMRAFTVCMSERNVRIWFTASCSCVMLSAIFRESSNCLARSASLSLSRGSILITSGWVCDLPAAVSFRV